MAPAPCEPGPEGNPMRLVNLDIREISLVNRPASGYRAFFKRRNCGSETGCDITYDFLKVDHSKREAYGVVYPLSDRPDRQGDYVNDPEELVKAERTWRNHGSAIWLQHKAPADGVEVLSSEITKADQRIEEQEIPKGSWVLRLKIHNDDIWQEIMSGGITAYSIAGTAQHVEKSQHVPVAYDNQRAVDEAREVLEAVEAMAKSGCGCGKGDDSEAAEAAELNEKAAQLMEMAAALDKLNGKTSGMPNFEALASKVEASDLSDEMKGKL